MPKHGLTVVDVIFSNHATKKQPKIHESMLVFSDKEGSLWKMRPSLLSFELKTEQPIFGGVYIIRGKNCVLYVGKSINIRRRVKDHLQAADKFVVDGVQQVITGVDIIPANDSIMHIIEMQLISKLRPVFNIDAVPLNPLKMELDIPNMFQMDGWEAMVKLKAVHAVKDASLKAFKDLLEEDYWCKHRK